MRVPYLLTFAIAVLTPLSLAHARDHYVDPGQGSDNGDGSAENPWRTFEQVVGTGKIETQHWDTLPYQAGANLETINPGAPIKAGDRVLLASGFHGELVLNGAYNASPIRIEAAAGAEPQFSRVTLRGAKAWVIKGLSVSPSHDSSSSDSTPIVSVISHNFHGPSSDVTIEDCDVFTAPDISQWSAGDWVAQAIKGIESNADDTTIRNNRVRNISFGISTEGLRAMVVGNSVRNFSGDGLRGLGDFNVFEYNYVANSYDVDENHDDGFQSWSVGEGGVVGTGEVVGVVLRGNLFLNREEADQNLSGPMQGIGGFDGFFVDWTIENNVVIVDHFHGITFTGARNLSIMNNTVIDLDDVSIGPPWIRITPHKDGRLSTGNIIRNNLVTALSLEGEQVEDHNIIVSDLDAFFVMPRAPWDLRLVPSATAIDSGSSEGAPRMDIDRVNRPQGDSIDIGAYEWTDGPISPADADVGSPDASGSDAGDDSGDATVAPTPDGGGPGSLESGCDCHVAGSSRSAVWLFALLALVLVRRSRRRL